MLRDLTRQPLSLVALALAFLANPALSHADEALLERAVLPILTKQCLGCHGGLRQKGGLDMRMLPAMLKGGKAGPAIKSGDANASPLWQRIADDEMPPTDKKLSATEKALIKQGIAAGLPTVAQPQQQVDPLLPANEKHTPQQVAAAMINIANAPSPRRN